MSIFENIEHSYIMICLTCEKLPDIKRWSGFTIEKGLIYFRPFKTPIQGLKQTITNVFGRGILESFEPTATFLPTYL